MYRKNHLAGLGLRELSSVRFAAIVVRKVTGDTMLEYLNCGEVMPFGAFVVIHSYDPYFWWRHFFKPELSNALGVCHRPYEFRMRL
jgi:hypothetical protein